MATRKRTFGRRRRQDHTGQRFGRLVAVRFDHISESKKTYWLFRCDCGGEFVGRIDQAKDGNTQSCGCLQREVVNSKGEIRAYTVGKRLDLTGRAFGRLAVLSFAEKRGRCLFWTCRCECGSECIVPTHSLQAGDSRSCGCLHREMSAEWAARIGRANKTHGAIDSPEYNTWHSMRLRCNNPGQPSYRHYGGRGIKVCERWNLFENFLADMGPRPSAKHSLDRIDNDKGYGPGNCRWATAKEQQRNRRKHRLLTYEGRTQPLSAWAEEVGLTTPQLHARIKYGWPIETALETPPGAKPDPFARGTVEPMIRLQAAAHAAVKVARRKGALIRPPACEFPGCTRPPAQAHHHKGYAREHWLDVVWYCRPHHEDAHHPNRKNRGL